MAFHTIWSVDLGRSALKAVKLRRDRSNVEIVAIDKIDYPMSKNGVDPSVQAKEALSIFRARNDVKEPLVVAHPGQGTFSRFIKVPAFDEKKVNDMVGYEASQQIPFPLDEVIWDHHIIQRDYLPGEEREVALFAVRREAMEDFLVDFTSEQMSVEMVSIGYLGLVNFVNHDIQPEEPAIILDVGATHTDLVLVDGNRFWIRALPHSGNEVTKAIRDRFKLSFAQAEKLKIEINKVPRQRVKQIFQSVIQPKLKELLGEIHRSLVFYRSQAGETSFSKLYLLGNASKTIGLSKFIEDQLKVQVTRVQTINHFRVSRDVNVRLLRSNLPSFASTLGCGIQGLGLGPCQVDLVPREEKLKKEVGRKKKHAYIAAAIVFALLFVAHFMLTGKLEDFQAAADLRRGSAVKTVDNAERDLESLIEDRNFQTQEVFEQRIAALRELVEFRLLVLAGIRAVEEVLSKFPNDHQVVLSFERSPGGNESPLENPEIRAKLLAFETTELDKMLWVASLDARAIQWPLVPEGSRRGKPALLQVPAYEFRAYVVIKLRATLPLSTHFIEENFQKPLIEKIRTYDLSKVPEVTIASGEEIPRILLARGGIGTRRRDLDVPQEGGGFYGAFVTWYLVPRLPPEEKKEDTEPGG